MATASFSGRSLHCPQTLFAGLSHQTHSSGKRSAKRHALRVSRIVAAANTSSNGNSRVIRGPCFVTRDVSFLWLIGIVSVSIQLECGLITALLVCLRLLILHLQNIDTDQIIPAEYLTLVPSKVRTACSHSSISSASKGAAKCA